MYSSSFAKRHVGYGPLGTGGIYRTDWRARKTAAWLDLQKLGVQTGKDEHQGLKENIDSVSTDPLLMKQVGKVSLGGMDLSPNADTIYVINLYDKKLYCIHVPADTSIAVKASDVVSFQLPDIQVKGGEMRPFAVKYYKGKIYVGAVSDASLSQNLKDLNAYVYELQPASGLFKQVFKIPLDYNRGAAVAGVVLNKWNPWSDEFSKALMADFPSTAVYQQPILSSIIFGLEGEVALGFMDRFGHLSGPGFPNPEGTAGYSGVAAGDILRVHFAAGEKFRMENNASVGSTVTEGKDNRQGPAGGEFYYQDGFVRKELGAVPRTVHEETATGSLVSMPDTKELLASVHEPDQFNSGGIKSFFSQDGKTGRTWQFYNDGERGTFGKANGMGAVALVSEKPMSYLGNRVWEDQNANGIQDAGEHGLANVSVELWHDGKSLSQTSTDKDGHYLFDDNNVPGGILPNTAYELRAKYTGAASIFKAGKDSETDNDAVDMGSFAAAAFQTQDGPVMRHAIDFGFLPQSSKAESVANFIVYPNPVVGPLTVKLTEVSSRYQLSVLNLYGRKMHVKAAVSDNEQQAQLDLSTLPSGLYIIAVDSDGGKRQTKTIFKLSQ